MKYIFLVVVMTITIGLLSVSSISRYLIPYPIKSDLVGKYQISTWDIGVKSPIIELKENGEFALSETTYGLCTEGKYDYNFEFEGCNTSFQCDQQVICAIIKKTFFGYKISFLKDSEGEEVLYEKTK